MISEEERRQAHPDPSQTGRGWLFPDVAWFVAQAAEGSFLMRGQVEPSQFFSWGELSRLVNQTGVRKNLLLDNKERTGVSTGEVLRGLQRGASLQLWNAEEHSPQMASTCARLSEELGGEAARCNVYLSPTSEHMAFHTHHDFLDAFIVQISGAKHWRVWERLVDSPIEVMKDHEQDVAGVDPKIETVLEPGDVLFVQRGDPHVAATVGKAPSLHLTIGLRRFTGQDLLEWLVRESKEEPGFRQSWPWGPDGERLDKERVAWIEQTTAEFAGWVRGRAGSDWLDRILNERAATRRVPEFAPLPGSIGSRHLEVHDRSVVEWSTPLLGPRLSGSTLYVLSKQIDVPADLVPVAERLCSGRFERWTVADLAQQHQVGAARIRRLVTELILLGMLRLVPGAEAGTP